MVGQAGLPLEEVEVPGGVEESRRGEEWRSQGGDPGRAGRLAGGQARRSSLQLCLLYLGVEGGEPPLLKF